MAQEAPAVAACAPATPAPAARDGRERNGAGRDHPRGRLARVPDITSVVLAVVAAVSGLTALSTGRAGTCWRPSRCRSTCCWSTPPRTWPRPRSTPCSRRPPSGASGSAGGRSSSSGAWSCSAAWPSLRPSGSDRRTRSTRRRGPEMPDTAAGHRPGRRPGGGLRGRSSPPGGTSPPGSGAGPACGRWSSCVLGHRGRDRCSGFALVSVFPGTPDRPGDRLVWTISEVTGTQFAGDIPGIGRGPARGRPRAGTVRASSRCSRRCSCSPAPSAPHRY